MSQIKNERNSNFELVPQKVNFGRYLQTVSLNIFNRSVNRNGKRLTVYSRSKSYFVPSCGEGRNTSSPKNACVEANRKIAKICLAGDGCNRSALWVMMHWRILDLLSDPIT